MVGAMSPENALRYSQGQKNIAVVTGGDRPDSQLAAVESSAGGIILTGGSLPMILLSPARKIKENFVDLA